MASHGLVPVDDSERSDLALEFAEETDVDHIVIGSHGRTGASRAPLGSVGETVARRAPVPVPIVR